MNTTSHWKRFDAHGPDDAPYYVTILFTVKESRVVLVGHRTHRDWISNTNHFRDDEVEFWCAFPKHPTWRPSHDSTEPSALVAK